MAFTPTSSLAPVTVTVAGTVAVSSVAGTVAISAAALPLPDGAATDDYQARELSALNDVALTAILERDKLAVE